MPKPKIDFDLSKIADGAVQEKFNSEMKKISENVLDLNTDPKKPRKVQITLKFSPNDNRDVIAVEVETKTTLAPQVGVSTSLMIGQGAKGEIEANELKSGIKGQTFIAEDGNLKTDKGEVINEDGEVVEEPAKILDLRKKQN